MQLPSQNIRYSSQSARLMVGRQALPSLFSESHAYRMNTNHIREHLVFLKEIVKFQDLLVRSLSGAED